MPESLFKYSIVVPVYNSGNTIRILLREIYQSMEGQGKFEVILVDDDSTDDSWQTLKAVYPDYKNLRIIRLSKNFGQSAATLCGIYRAQGATIITLDDDLQYPPSQLPKMIAFFEQQAYFMVLGVPERKQQPLSYLIFEQLIRLFFRFHNVGHLNGKNISSSFRIFRSDLNFSEDFPQGRIFSIHVATLMISPRHIGHITIEHNASAIRHSRYSFISRLKGFVQLLFEYNISPMPLLRLGLVTLLVTAAVIWSFLGYDQLICHLPLLIFFMAGLLAAGQLIQLYYLKRINARQMGTGPYLVIEEHG